MESHPKNPELRNNPENFHPCQGCNHPAEEERELAALLYVLQLPCSVSLPQGAVGWSVIVAFPGHTHLPF